MSERGRIRLAGIAKKYGDFTAIHNLDLEIQPGEFFAFLGPSGSGKTTSLRPDWRTRTRDGSSSTTPT